MPKLTEPTLREYRPTGKRREICDAKATGLYLIIQPKPTGTMSWALRFRRPDGRPAKLTLGPVAETDEPSDDPVIGGALTLRQARELAAKIDRDRARGIDVIEQRKAELHRQATATATAAANSFGALAREFFVDHKTKKWQQRPRHWRADARLLGLAYPRDCDPAQTQPEVIPGSLAATWADKPMADIDSHNIHTVIDEARKRGIPGLPRHNDGTSESRGRKMHAALSNLFRWAQQKRKIANNATVGVWHPGPPAPRQRAMSNAEIKVFWQACEQLYRNEKGKLDGPPYGLLFQLLLLTGQRLDEVTGMSRAELSEDGSTWAIPDNRTKNHRPHLVPLPPLARTIIAQAPRIENASGYVFTVSGKKLTGFSKAKDKVDDLMHSLARRPCPAWRLHDLRRTCATGMAEIGIQPHIIEAVLNHVSGHKAGVAGTYNVAAYAAEKKVALERWAAHVEGVITDRPANVVPLHGGAA
jgi:integrase